MLTLVLFGAGADMHPASALASPAERANFFAGASYLQDDNGNRDDNGNENRNNDDENRHDNDENRSHDDKGNGNGNHQHDNGENREADTGPQFASAGNGGVAAAAADGGLVLIGHINSGGNAGNAIGVGDTTWGSVTVDGGDVVNSTGIAVAADGGTGIADASGGNGNLAGAQD